ncbi:MAG: SoxR reducing system RseC family protein [Bacteroidetes bacterium]|uniref:SoxR reducing system RseC family protein n=1 Tax=Candidatus Cryptobacteroides intestinavium TaxID=2840766 RepID=A0A9D9ESB5_9BACT|nr:SoxR reducing system RseC family protein [Candidatus Cryptobacteroides intestinavium]
MSKNEVSHEGTILEITPEFTTVEIIAQSACAACHARGLCGVADEKQKIIMVPTDPYGSYKEGDKVLVLLKKSMGMKAVWISYVIPLFILMILVLSLSSVTAHEVYAGLAGIGGVALYYLVIYLFRDKLANDFVFYIKEK